MENGTNKGIGRRSLLLSVGATAAMPMLAGEAAAAARRKPRPGAHAGSGRRKLGNLEVSSIGLGVQNNSRKYTTEVPYRPEQVALIRSAYFAGPSTLYDSKRMALWKPERNKKIVKPIKNTL